MKREEAFERIREIQRIAERTTLYTMLPGAQAVIGGLLALAGCAASYAMLGSTDFGELLALSFGTQVGFFAMWAVIGLAAVAQHVVLTMRAARRLGVSPVGRPGRVAGFSLTPSIFVAIVLSLRFLQDECLGYAAPVWMMCYGTGVYAAGLFSVRLPRLLGLGFIAMGAAGLVFFVEYGVLLTAASFGMLHVIFGLAVISRSRQSAS